MTDSFTNETDRRNRQLCQYIRNTAQVPLKADDFDDDWSPVGPMYRDWLTDAGLIETGEGGITLTPAGEALL